MILCWDCVLYHFYSNTWKSILSKQGPLSVVTECGNLNWPNEVLSECMVALAVTDAIGVISIYLVCASINTITSCPQGDLHYPEFESMDDVANSISATSSILHVCWHFSQTPAAASVPIHMVVRNKSNELDPTFWSCPSALQACSSCSSCLHPASAKTTLNPQRMHPSN